VNILLKYVKILDSLIAAYIQFVLMLMKLHKVLSHELECLCSKSTTLLSEWTIPKIMDISYTFTALEINKYIVEKCMYTL